jgi:hypothetical protein
MLCYCLIVSTCIVFSLQLYGQEEIVYNARLVGIAETGITICDVWSVTNNQAGLAFQQKKQYGINCDTRYMLPDLSTQTVIASLPVNSGSIAGLFSYFGCNPYHEEHLCLAYGRKIIKWLDAGIGLYYHHYVVDAINGKASSITGDIGILAIPEEELRIGLQFVNLSHSKYNNSNRDDFPTDLRFGLSYSETDENYFIGTQLNWENFNRITISIGSEWLLMKSLFIRFGIKIPYNSRYSFGLGTHARHLKIDLGFEQNPALGLSSSISLIIQPGKDE